MALGAPVTAAAAPVLAPLEPCYVVASARQADRQAVTVSGRGFTPGALVDIAFDGVLQATVQADAAGRLPPGSAAAPFVEAGSRPFRVTATEQGGGLPVEARSRVARLEVTTTPRRPRSPATRTRFAGRGFTAGGPVFVHYVRGGVERRRLRLVDRPAGACGTFSVRRRLFPFLPQVGRWTLQVDQQRRYAPRPATALWRLRVSVVE